MAKPRDLPDLAALAVPGTVIDLHAAPSAARNRIDPGPPLRVFVTAPPDKGAANTAIRKLLAKAMGVAPSRLDHVQGTQSRHKRFVVLG